jgi:purine-binding chemotaxis protein CheW
MRSPSYCAKHQAVSEKRFADAARIVIYISLIYILRAASCVEFNGGYMTRAMENDRFLLCRIGTRIGALTLHGIQETLRPLPVEPLAGAPPFVLGVSILRGVPTPVIDVGRLLGPRSSTIGRFIAVKVGARHVALGVEAVLDIRSLPTRMLAEVPGLLGEASATLLSAVGSLDAELLMVLEAYRLVPESVWNSMDASRTPA